jgi:hypothetical protein
MEGRRAYALERALLYNAWSTRWASKWTPVVCVARKSLFKSAVRDLGARARKPTGPVVINVRRERAGEDVDVHGDSGVLDSGLVAAS